MKNYNVYIIDDDYSKADIKDYLKNKLLISRRTISKLKNTNGILLNGDRVNVNTKLKIGDKLEVILREETSDNIYPEFMALDIVFEDEYLIIINKPPGIPVHPSRKHFMGTLANGLMYYLMGKSEDTRIRPINRLDKDTSGLVVFAKNPQVQHLLSINERFAFQKEYVAVVGGVLYPESGEICANIAREAEGSMKRVVRADGAKAMTHYSVLKSYKDATLVHIKLVTGRTHQIRVHMSHIGHPLLGDELYGGNCDLIHRQALHAYRVEFIHPILNEKKIVVSGLTEDLKNLLNKLEK